MEMDTRAGVEGRKERREGGEGTTRGTQHGAAALRHRAAEPVRAADRKVKASSPTQPHIHPNKNADTPRDAACLGPHRVTVARPDCVTFSNCLPCRL